MDSLVCFIFALFYPTISLLQTFHVTITRFCTIIQCHIFINSLTSVYSKQLRQLWPRSRSTTTVYINVFVGSDVTQLRTTTHYSELPKLIRLQVHTKTNEKLIRELLFVDDIALVAHTESAMQRITSCFAETAQHFGLEVSLKKTEVLHQPAPLEEYRDCINVYGTIKPKERHENQCL